MIENTSKMGNQILTILSQKDIIGSCRCFTMSLWCFG